VIFKGGIVNANEIFSLAQFKGWLWIMYVVLFFFKSS